MTSTELFWQAVPSSHCRLGEGPVWLPGREMFQWVDILEPALCRWNPYDASPVERRPLPLEFSTAAIPLSDDVSLVASRDSIHEYDWATDSIQLVGQWEFPPDVRFNDGGISPDGDIYIGTMSMERARGRGGLFRYDSGRLETVIAEVGISNGLGWAANGSMYYIDSLEPIVWRIEGSDRSVHHRFADTDEPDGLAVARDGSLLVAMWDAGEIRYLSADGAASVPVALPASCPTSVAIGGRDFELLLVTTADVADVSDGIQGISYLGQLSELQEKFEKIVRTDTERVPE